MLNALIRFSLRYRMLVIVASLAVMFYGSYLATTLPIDVFPDLDRPRVVLLTECGGLSPEEVETLVTQPMEAAILGATGVQAVRSQSTLGLVVIYIEFDWHTDVRTARQVVQERLSTISGSFPEGIRPQMMPPTSIMGQIMHVGLYHRPGPKQGTLAPLGTSGLMAELHEPKENSAGKEEPAVSTNPPSPTVWHVRDRNAPETWQEVAVERVEWQVPPVTSLTSQATPPASARQASVVVEGREHSVTFRSPAQRRMDLRSTADWILRPRLLKTTGIAEVIVLGGDRKQYQVLVNPDLLLEFGVTLADVEQALKDSNVNASGGFTSENQMERPIRLLGRLGPEPEKVLQDLRNIPIKIHPKRNVLLGQVAEVTEGGQPKRGDGSIDGFPGVVITLVKQPHVDTRAVTDRIVAALRDVESSVPADLAVTTDLFQLRKFIDRGVYYVGEALVIGAVLVVIILSLFLLNFRTTFITLTAIPLSLVVTTLAFRLIGWLTGTELSINVMTLGGIAVAMGELVDDAIVDVENIFRRLRQNHASRNPLPAIQVVYDASREVRSAIVFGTAVVILVFLPLFALSGVEGRLFAPLGIAYIVSILASLLVSLTVTPVLSLYMLPNSKATHHDHDSALLQTLKRLASGLIRFSMARAGTLLFLTWIGVGVSFWLLTRLGADFLPQFDEGSVQVNLSLPSGSSLAASNEVAVLVDAKFRQLQKTAANPHGEILHFVRRTGRAELDEHAEPVNKSEYILNMNPEAGQSREETLRKLLAELKSEIPGVDVEAEQPLAHLISHMLSGVNAQIAIKIFGDDLDTLRRSAEQIKSVVATVPGITAPVIELQNQADELHIRLRAEDLAFHGLNRAYVAEFVQTALLGETVSQVLDGQRRFDLVVKIAEPFRTDYTRLEELRIDLPNGKGQVKLSEIADFPEAGVGPNQINRENVRRRIVIRCNALGRDLAGAASEIEQRVQQTVTLPEGYFVEYGGQFESQRSATLLIGMLALVSLVGMFVVLMLLYPSVRITLQILNAIPTAFIGGVLALVLTGQTLTVASLVGFVSLGGIAVRNGILLVTHYFHLIHEEGETFSPAMVLRGSLERLSPVLMTALTAGIGLVPIVVGGRKPGLEILYPVATVILGGLITSTFCEFLIHPGLFWRFSGRDTARLNQREEIQTSHELHETHR